MARIAGVNIPTNKPVAISLRYIYGIGPVNALEICSKTKIEPAKRVNELSDAEVLAIREIIDRDYVVEGDLRREVSINIKRLVDLGCYRGLRQPQGSSRARPAHSHQRPHPQGSRQGDRRQEEVKAEQNG